MLITRAPVRISLAGGGTDLPAYYERHGGLVISTSIDKYFYAILGVNDPDRVQISSSDYRSFYRHRASDPLLWDGDMGLVRAALHEFGFDGGISLFLASEVPPGTGLGSSSAVAAALVKALATARGEPCTPQDVAEKACVLELERLGSPIGKQDQYAAAYGGLNAITFSKDGVEVERLAIDPEVRARLERNLLLFFTGSTRSANAILRHQSQASLDDDGPAVAALHAIKAAAQEVRVCLDRGDLRRFGEILADTWEQKKRLATGITTPHIDEAYDLARRHGAIGGKVAGAGGGGFLMIYCEEPYQEQVRDALEGVGLHNLDYRFDEGGAQVLMSSLARNGWRRPRPAERVLEYV